FKSHPHARCTGKAAHFFLDQDPVDLFIEPVTCFQLKHVFGGDVSTNVDGRHITTQAATRSLYRVIERASPKNLTAPARSTLPPAPSIWRRWRRGRFAVFALLRGRASGRGRPFCIGSRRRI